MAEEIKIVASAVGFDQVNKALDSTSKTLTQTSEAAVKAGKALNTELKTGSTQASQSITNLSRVLQDAPFGFIGIANNINPLIESFSRLKAESGSVGGALKSLVGGLAGGGGLGIAFAAITSAITFAQIGLSMWSRGSDKAKKSSEEFSDQLENTKESLKAVTEELKNFIAVGESAARLNDINIKARFDDKGTQDVLTRQAKFITISEDLQAAIEALDKARQNNLNLTQEQGQSEKDYQDALKTSRDVLSKAIDEVARLTQAREEQAAANRLAAIEERRAAEERRRAQPAFDRDLKFKPIKVDRIEVSSKKIREEIEKELSKITVPSIIEVPIEFLPAKNFEISQDQLDQLNAVFENAAQNIAVGFGETLGNALSGQATIGDFFVGIFQEVGAAMVAFGKLMISFAINVEAIKKFVLANPVLAIAGAVALIAIGTLIRNATRTPGFAVGTRNAPGGMALVGERGPEMINLPRGSQVIPAAQTSQMMGGIGGAIEVFGMLRGQDIFFSNKKYGQTYKRTT
jgi:hypothetical protein